MRWIGERICRFNTQPPEGGWTARQGFDAAPTAVSTHSRPKAAGGNFYLNRKFHNVSTHSRPKAAGFAWCQNGKGEQVSTHSRPKAAGSVAI